MAQLQRHPLIKFDFLSDSRAISSSSPTDLSTPFAGRNLHLVVLDTKTQPLILLVYL